MRLRTLGGLSFGDSRIHREKPLTLAAYLALEGPKPRRHLAQLFWPEASDPLNSFSVALAKLRRLNLAGADELRAWSVAEQSCDAADLRDHLRAGRAREAVELYAGAFLDGAALAGFGEELEEWVYATREDFGRGVRATLLRLAEQADDLGQRLTATGYAEQAYRLSGAPPADPELLPRFHALLADQPLGPALSREAAELGLHLITPVRAAPLSFVGRAAERQKLAALGVGQWAWVRAASGVGKTALLNQLASDLTGVTRLPGRHGLPFVTLEPLLGAAIEAGAALQHLRALPGWWLIDAWEGVDAESRALLTQLRGLGTAARVVIAANGPPDLRVDTSITLGPLSAEELQGWPDAYARTGGVPALVGAMLRQEHLEDALAGQLDGWPVTVQTVYAALLLADHDRLGWARRALALDPGAFHTAVQLLLDAGLIERDGTPRALGAGQHWLEQQPGLVAGVALHLARCAPPLDAYPLYERAGAVGHLPEAHGALLAWASETLRRGFPERAIGALHRAPGEDAAALRVRALEVAGRYGEALAELDRLPQATDHLGLRAALLWHVGQPEAARTTARAALNGSPAVRAEALNTLGKISMAEGDPVRAAGAFRRAAALWRATGDDTARLFALNNLGVALTHQGVPAEEAYREAMLAAQDHPAVLASVFINVGLSHRQADLSTLALEAYHRAVAIADGVGARDTLALAWNNIGVVHHQDLKADEARAAYEQAVSVARSAGDARMLGLVLGNLAELDEDEDAWEEAILLLERAGQFDMQASIQASLDAFRDRSGGRQQD